jgi:hypothetical protein
MVIRYHKGIKNTLVYLGNDKYEINDIIVRQDGEIFADWDFTNNTLLPTILLHQRTIEETRAIHRKIVEETRNIGGCGGGDGKGHLRQQLPENYTSCGGIGGCGGGVNYTPRFSCGGGGCGGGC